MDILDLADYKLPDLVDSPLKIQGKKTVLVGPIFNLIRSITEEHKIHTVVEPFAGTGVVGMNLFNLLNCFEEGPGQDKWCNVHMFDSCKDFVNFFNRIQFLAQNPNEMAFAVYNQYLSDLVYMVNLDKANYYRLRNDFNKNKDKMPPAQRDFIFLFLNRTAFNGIVRYNKSGGLNTPFGKNLVVDGSLQTLMANVDIATQLFSNKSNFKLTYMKNDFRDTISLFEDEPTVFYCDPPYLNRNAQYHDGWTQKDQNDLRTMLLNSKNKFIVSSWNDVQGSNDAELNKWTNCQQFGFAHKYMVGPKEENRPQIIEVLIVRA